MINFKDIEEASLRLKDIIRATPLIQSEFFSEEYGNDIYIKPENLQKTGAFKIRGAYNKIFTLSEEVKKRGLIASSAGNHAQGVAYAARKLLAKATIVMPRTTPLIKVEATKKLGARVILEGDIYDEAYEKAMELSKEEGLEFIHPFDDYDVMAGQGTIGIEILKELPDADAILVPIGGGGLIAGIAIAAKNINPNVKIIGVEPEGAATLRWSLEKGCVTNLEEVQTIADGVAVRRAGDLTFNIIKDYVDKIITVSDFDIMESFLMLLERHKIIAENAGVLSLAALKKYKEKNKKVVSLVSGGNIDVLTISGLIDQGLINRGRVFCFSVELPDKPGQLLEVAGILSGCNANVVKLDHNQFKSLDRLHRVLLEVTIETNGKEHIKEITEELNKKGYQIEQIY